MNLLRDSARVDYRRTDEKKKKESLPLGHSTERE